MDTIFVDIKKRKIILENRMPYARETQAYLRELNETDMVYSSLRLDGSELSRTTVSRILKGEFLVEVSVSGHVAIGNYQEVVRLMREMVEMRVYLDETNLQKLYGLLVRSASVSYRKSNPVLRMMDYNPPHFKEIPEQMEFLFHWLRSELHQNNPIEKAAHLHNKLIEIYPFESGSEALARMAAQHHLMNYGYPPILWNIGETEYYDGISRYLKRDDVTPMYSVLERGVFNKMEVMMQVTGP